MSGQRPVSYPSPNSAQVASGVPFYNQNAVSQASDVPAMAQLSEELSRQLNNDLHHGDSVILQQSMGQAHQQLAQDAMGQLDVRADFDDDDDDESDSEGGTHKRKRHKSSREDKRQKNTRACDECRRKKVKCESEVGQDLGIEACLACRKSGLNCQFSRVPQKRGPSKGYITKLDERLHNVESAIRDFIPAAAHRIGRPDPADLSMYSPVPDIVPQAQAGASNHDVRLDFTGNGDASSFWHTGPTPSATHELSAIEAAVSEGIDETNLKDCHQAIQAVLPILPEDQTLLRNLTSQVPNTTRSAFSAALGCFTRASSTGKGAVDGSQIQAAAALFAQAEFDHSTSSARHLILIQTAIILALATDALGPVAAHGGSCPSSRSWLSRANSIATDMRINLQPDPQKLVGTAGDTEGKLARRIYVSLFILDKWFAVGNATPQLISSRGLMLLPEDQSLLSPQCYHLARLSFVLAHLLDLTSELSSTPTSDLMPGRSTLLRVKNLAAALCQAELDRVRESMQSFISMYPVLHAAFWHVQSLVLRIQEHTAKPALVEHAGKVAAILSDATALSSPLHHHCAVLAGATIAESAVQSGVESVAGPAASLEQALAASSVKGGAWAHAINAFVQSGTGAAGAMLGLQGLADMAVGEGQAAQQVFEGAFDATMILREGYLNLLVPRMGNLERAMEEDTKVVVVQH